MIVVLCVNYCSTDSQQTDQMSQWANCVSPAGRISLLLYAGDAKCDIHAGMKIKLFDNMSISFVGGQK